MQNVAGDVVAQAPHDQNAGYRAVVQTSLAWSSASGTACG
jgi:hypothetical protein